MKNYNLLPEEEKILKDLSNGKSYHEIADYSDMPFGFLTAFLKFIYGKLGVQNRMEAEKKYLQYINGDSKYNYPT